MRGEADEQLSQAEQDVIVKKMFASPDDVRGTSFSLQACAGIGLGSGLWLANGITLAGFKFMTVRAEPEEVIGRKGVSSLPVLEGMEAEAVGTRSVHRPYQTGHPRCRSQSFLCPGQEKS